jgi:predicted metal-dependent HD superfamily phosphohydrolase
MMDARVIRAALASCAAALRAPDELWLAVYQGYQQGAPRHYHTFDHVVEVARRHGEVARDAGWHRPREVSLALLFHDIVYQPGATDNEARSARQAIEAVDRWLDGAGLDSAYIARLIELTARHGALAPGDVSDEEALFLDCDMAILGAAPDAYAAYEAGIAAEYGAVYAPALYRQGRKHFLERLLARERIYLSDYFHARLDERARANLRCALARLDSPG